MIYLMFKHIQKDALLLIHCATTHCIYITV